MPRLHHKMIKVSVIIPNYNRSALIGHTIENMLSQSLPPHEVIVVDDGSSDDSMSVIKSFGNNVKVLVQENKGPGAARNNGLRIATGNFIQFMDSDDLASLNKLEVQAKIAASNNIDLVYGPWVKVNINGSELSLQDVVLQLRPVPDHRDLLFWFLTHWSMVFQQCMVRKSVLDRVGGYREDIRYLEDGDLFVRLLLNNISVMHERETLTLYRLGGNDKLTENNKLFKRRAIDQAKYYESIIQLSATSSQLNKYMMHWECKLKLKQAINDLDTYASEHSELKKLFFDFLGGNKDYYNMMTWVINRFYGIKQRLVGHRWHGCFESGQLMKEQIDLIQSLGFNISNKLG